MLPITRRGLRSCSRSTVKPSRSSTPTRKFSSSTSERRTSAASTPASSASLRSRTIDSLLRLADMKYVESSWCAARRPGPGRPPRAGVVAGRALHLDHPGPEVAQHHRGLRAGEGTGQVEHDDVGQRPLVGHAGQPSRRRTGPVGRGWLGGAMTSGPTTYHLVPPSHATAEPVTLDPEQQRVVDHAGGPLLVLAGPGTGKTTTLVEAIADRIEQPRRRPGADPGADLLPQGRRAAARPGHRPARPHPGRRR